LAGLALALGFIIFGTEEGRTLVVAALLISAAVWAFRKIIHGLGTAFRKFKDSAIEAGGWDIAIGNFLFELKPTFTEFQKIQKIADRQLRASDAAHLKLFRQEQAREKHNNHQRAIEAAWEKRRADAYDKLVTKVARLENKFAKVAHLRFEYSNQIDVYAKTNGSRYEMIIRLNCELGPSNLSSYRIQTAPQFGYATGTTFLDLPTFVDVIRGILRIIAAEQVVRNS
jgi:hypothetical protein